jgi:hypothetical protein
MNLNWIVSFLIDYGSFGLSINKSPRYALKKVLILILQ